jgi:hypothetical protein
MRSFFPLFQSHLDLAHDYWARLVKIGDAIIDATSGNGYDTLKLCQLALSIDKGKVYAFDIQSTAIESTRQLIQHFPAELRSRIHLEQRCHSTFPDMIVPESIRLIVYNLGYLPGGDKRLTTCKDTTLQSLSRAKNLLLPGGAISITCYPGHAEGAQEQEALLDYTSRLSPSQWSCCHHVWLNRQQAPSLLLIQKNLP